MTAVTAGARAVTYNRDQENHAMTYDLLAVHDEQMGRRLTTGLAWSLGLNTLVLGIAAVTAAIRPVMISAPPLKPLELTFAPMAVTKVAPIVQPTPAPVVRKKEVAVRTKPTRVRHTVVRPTKTAKVESHVKPTVKVAHTPRAETLSHAPATPRPETRVAVAEPGAVNRTDPARVRTNIPSALAPGGIETTVNNNRAALAPNGRVDAAVTGARPGAPAAATERLETSTAPAGSGLPSDQLGGATAATTRVAGSGAGSAGVRLGGSSGVASVLAVPSATPGAVRLTLGGRLGTGGQLAPGGGLATSDKEGPSGSATEIGGRGEITGGGRVSGPVTRNAFGGGGGARAATIGAAGVPGGRGTIGVLASGGSAAPGAVSAPGSRLGAGGRTTFTIAGDSPGSKVAASGNDRGGEIGGNGDGLAGRAAASGTTTRAGDGVQTAASRAAQRTPTGDVRASDKAAGEAKASEGPSTLEGPAPAKPGDLAPTRNSGGSAGGSNRDAEEISAPSPRLTDAQKKRKFDGRVLVEVTVDADGSHSASLLQGSGDDEIDGVVLRALRNWRWRPALRNGEKVRSVKKFRYNIRVDD